MVKKEINDALWKRWWNNPEGLDLVTWLKKEGELDIMIKSKLKRRSK